MPFLMIYGPDRAERIAKEIDFSPLKGDQVLVLAEIFGKRPTAE